MLARTENPLSFRPRMVLAYADSARAALNSRQLRRMGWEVHQACSGPEARRLVYALRPQVVILDAELRGESGWLTCAKLTLGGAGPRVLLLSAEVTPREQEFAEVVGAAAVVPSDAGLPALIEEVHEAVVAAAG
jgi:CheY-like chemotaxis protein